MVVSHQSNFSLVNTEGWAGVFAGWMRCGAALWLILFSIFMQNLFWPASTFLYRTNYKSGFWGRRSHWTCYMGYMDLRYWGYVGTYHENQWCFCRAQRTQVPVSHACDRKPCQVLLMIRLVEIIISIKSTGAWDLKYNLKAGEVLVYFQTAWLLLGQIQLSSCLWQ